MKVLIKANAKREITSSKDFTRSDEEYYPHEFHCPYCKSKLLQGRHDIDCFSLADRVKTKKHIYSFTCPACHKRFDKRLTVFNRAEYTIDDNYVPTLEDMYVGGEQAK